MSVGEPPELALGRERISRLLAWRCGRAAPPLELIINITGQCNLKCIFCPCAYKRSFSRRSGRSELSYRDWERVVHDASDFGVKIWAFSYGDGEPMMRKEATVRLINLIKTIDGSHFCRIMTNATLFDECDVDALVRSRLDKMEISLDAPDPAVNDFLRGRKGAFARVMRTLRMLGEAKARLGSEKPAVWVSPTVTRMNVASLNDLVRLCSRNGVQNMTFSPLIVYRKMFARLGSIVLPARMRNEVGNHLEDVLKAARETMMDVKLWPVEEYLYSGRVSGKQTRLSLLEPENGWSVECAAPEASGKATPALVQYRKTKQDLREDICATYAGRKIFLDEPADLQSGRLSRKRKNFGGFLSHGCFTPFLSLTLSAGGNAYLCSFRSFALKNFNVRDSSLKQIWLSDEMRRTRALLKHGKTSECSRCFLDNVTDSLRSQILLLAPDILQPAVLASLAAEVRNSADLMPLASRRLEAGDYATAVCYFERVVQLDPGSARGHAGHIAALRLQGREAEARAAVGKAVKYLDTAAATDVLLRLGNVMEVQEILDSSSGIIKKAQFAELRKKIDFCRSIDTKALLKSGLGCSVFSMAIESIGGARELVDAGLLEKAADLFMESKHWGYALFCLERLRHLRGDEVQILCKMIQYYVEVGQPRKGLKMLRKLESYGFPAEVQPSVIECYVDVLYWSARCLIGCGMMEPAAEYMKTLLRADPKFKEAGVSLLGCLLECGSTEDAMKEANSPEGLLDEEDIIGCMLKAGRSIDAIRRLHAAGRQKRYREPQNKPYLAGRCYKEAGNPRRALRYFGFFLRKNPSSVIGLRDSGECLLDLGRFDEALGMLKAAVELDPSVEWTMFSIGRTCEKMGDLGEAKRWHAKNLYVSGQNPLSYFHSCKALGTILMSEGNFKDAVSVFRKALSYQKDDRQIAIGACREKD